MRLISSPNPRFRSVKSTSLLRLNDSSSSTTTKGKFKESFILCPRDITNFLFVEVEIADNVKVEVYRTTGVQGLLVTEEVKK